MKITGKSTVKKCIKFQWQRVKTKFYRVLHRGQIVAVGHALGIVNDPIQFNFRDENHYFTLDLTGLNKLNIKLNTTINKVAIERTKNLVADKQEAMNGYSNDKAMNQLFTHVWMCLNLDNIFDMENRYHYYYDMDKKCQQKQLFINISTGRTAVRDGSVQSSQKLTNKYEESENI